MTYHHITCCSILLRLKLKYLFVILFFIAFHFAIFLVLRFCVNLTFEMAENNQSLHYNRGNVIFVDIDWHDYQYLEREARRKGLAEHGMAAQAPDEDYALEQKSIRTYGYNGHLSDLISLDRSVADIRPIECRSMKYSATLPGVSIIIIFNNEHLKTLLRTCVSILNRSPVQLMNEIILVDDASNFDDLQEPLDDYVEENASKIKLIRLEKRSGLIRARLAGARLAKSEVLLFLDAHCEVNTNWLPPLLDPIVKNYKRVMCPMIDIISSTNFAYSAQDYGARGAFDWNFDYKRLPRLPEDMKHPAKPYISPIMAGGLFAISEKFFWELGGYDEELDTWGGEQYELSFKIWMCGGEMYDAPCSRVGHIFRSGGNPHPHVRGAAPLHRNYKRVAEVWMDEYKQYLYDKKPQAFEGIDAGNLTLPRLLRERLQCKTFDWFLREIAFDLMRDYPPHEESLYAWGSVYSLSAPHLCVTVTDRTGLESLQLTKCDKNLTHPTRPETHFHFTWRSEIRMHNENLCWDANSGDTNPDVIIHRCHHRAYNQRWHFHEEENWITHGSKKTRCLTFDFETKQLMVDICDKANKRMQWDFGGMDLNALATLRLD